MISGDWVYVVMREYCGYGLHGNPELIDVYRDMDDAVKFIKKKNMSPQNLNHRYIMKRKKIK